MKIDLKQVEEACKDLYVRALKILPPDIKEGFARLDKAETDALQHGRYTAAAIGHRREIASLLRAIKFLASNPSRRD